MARNRRLSTLVSREDKDVIERFLQRVKDAEASQSDQREACRQDLEFLLPGGQWPAELKEQRENEDRPCLEIDRITPFVNQLVNEQRQNRPQPVVNPVSDGTDKKTAEVIQGLMRHIMYMSNGDIAIDTAYESMVRCGVGYVRVVAEFVGDTFDKELKVKRISDPLSVYLDPSSDDPTGADAEWGAICTWLTRSEYKQQFPNSKLADANDKGIWAELDQVIPNWASEGDEPGVMVAEYYERQYRKGKIYLYEDGSITDQPIDGMTAVREREVTKPTIKWYKLNAVEILEATEWPGRYIPIIPVYGNESYVNGKRMYSGLVRTTKTMAQIYSYMQSSLVETIALAPKAPIMAPLGSIVDPAKWAQINRRPMAYVEYKPSVEGIPVNAPMPITYSMPINDIVTASMSAEANIKAITGMYDPVRGVSDSGQSGVAIRQLQRQGQSVNYHYSDNLGRMTGQLGRVLLEAIPVYYDAPRVVRTVKPDDTEELVKINEEYIDPKTGQLTIYRPGAGDYDVTVSVGPSYQTKRQESQAMLEALLQNPVMGGLLAQKAPDIIVSLMDFHQAQPLKERLTPPEFADNSGIPPQVQQQMQQMQQQLQQYEQMLQQAGQQIQQLQAENESKQADIQLKMQEMDYKSNSDSQKAALDQEKMALDRMKLELEARKLDIEAATLKLNAIRGAMQPVVQSMPKGEAPESGNEREEPEELAPDAIELDIEVPENVLPMARRPITTEEVGSLLAQQADAFQQALAVLAETVQSVAMAPKPEPKPLNVVLKRNANGTVTGTVE